MVTQTPPRFPLLTTAHFLPLLFPLGAFSSLIPSFLYSPPSSGIFDFLILTLLTRLLPPTLSGITYIPVGKTLPTKAEKEETTTKGKYNFPLISFSSLTVHDLMGVCISFVSFFYLGVKFGILWTSSFFFLLIFCFKRSS
jgi:hypothetical protein